MAVYDLLLKGGTLIDPAQGIHGRRDVAFSNQKVAAVEDEIATTQAGETIDASGLIVAPGLIDLHVHVFDHISWYGIPPDPHCLARGVTTAVDAGSAGADTFSGFRKWVIEPSETRLFAMLHISSQGMLSSAVGELDDIKWSNVSRASQVIEENRDLILGVKVRLTRDSVVGERAGLLPLYHAREAADATGLPIMVHPQEAWCRSLDDIIALMKAGDILTHCYLGRTHGILDEKGRIRRSVREARERGVLFDVGHGAGSFSWRVCEAALEQGFPPTTISSDLHSGSYRGPVFDLVTTVSKFLHLGYTLDEALLKVTAAPAQIIGMADEIGTLRVGARGDAVLLHLEEGGFGLTDSMGETRVARQRIVPKCVIKEGTVYKEKSARGHTDAITE